VPKIFRRPERFLDALREEACNILSRIRFGYEIPM
jgi:hypothetical protein